MSNRKSLPAATERAVLVKSRRRCCLCYWLEAKDERQKGQIAHLDKDRNNHKEDNLCFLCFDDHDAYDSKTSQSKNLEKGEIKHYRNELYKEMELRFHALEVERNLRLVKQKFREAAHEALALRASDKTSLDDALKWVERTTPVIKKMAGEPAEFDFKHCLEGCHIELPLQEKQIPGYLYVHASYLKELAASMDATDLVEHDTEQGN